jgi:intein/homing endonuclease
MSEWQKGYIAGFFDGEGSVSEPYIAHKPWKRWVNRRIAITNSNLEMLQNLKQMLTNCGIYSTLHIEAKRTSTFSNKPVYDLRISGYANLKKFRDLIPVQDAKKGDIIQKIIESYDGNKKTQRSEEEILRVFELRLKNYSLRKISKETNIPQSTILGWLKSASKGKPQKGILRFLYEDGKLPKLPPWEEQCRQMKEIADKAKIGKRHSEETKRKMSEAHKRRLKQRQA